MANETLRRLGHLLGAPSIAIYGERVRLRQDDLLVRSRASASLGRAASGLRDLAVRYRVERIPSASREQPFPPAAALEALRTIERRERAVQELEVKVRSAPFPPEDDVWERLRSARLQLDTLLLLDIDLIERAADVESACEALTPDRAADGEPGPLETALAAIQQTLRDRTELLSPPA